MLTKSKTNKANEMKLTKRKPLAESEKANLLHKRTVDEIEGRINLPASFFERFDDEAPRIKLTYLKESKTTTWVLFPLEVATLMKEQGLIKYYSVSREGVSMYTTVIVTRYNANGAPYQDERPVRVRWTDIQFSSYEVIRFCAEREWKKTAGKVIVGLFNTVRNVKNAIG